MPKQIVTKKENPVIMKNLTIPTDPGENTNVVRTNSKKVFSPASNQNLYNSSIKNESQNQNISKQSNSVSPDKPVSVPSRPSTGKKNISLEEKSNYDDRITPFDMQRSKSKKSITTVTTLNQGNTIINSISKDKNSALSPDNWICDYCNTINKPYEYKCRGILNYLIINVFLIFRLQENKSNSKRDTRQYGVTYYYGSESK
jgi:hypothetical protein